MPSKYVSRNFEPGFHYHIYNRGGFKNDIFLDDRDYETFLEIIEYYLRLPTGKPRSVLSRLLTPKEKNKGPTLVIHNVSSFDIVAFCLMPNHFHFLIKQRRPPSPNTSIANFMKRLCVTYAMYFIEKYKHSGNLFQGKYKNILVESEEYLLYLTKYIHLNPQRTEPTLYPYSSCSHFIGTTNIPWLNANEILAYFSKTNPKLSYKSFLQGDNPEFELLNTYMIDRDLT